MPSHKPNLSTCILIDSNRPRGRRPIVEDGNISINTSIVLFISTFIQTFGYSPTVREIARHVGLTVAPTWERLADLKERKIIWWKDKCRCTITVLQPNVTVF